MNIKFYQKVHTADGVSTNYDTPFTFLENSALVFVNAFKREKGVDYNEDDDLQGITFTSVIDAGDTIEIFFAYTEVTEITETASIDELSDILNGIVNIKRETDLLLDNQAISASMSVDRQPLKQCRLGITVQGATITTGLISVAGTTNEDFNFSGNGVVIGEKDYSNISSITVDGISDGFIEIKSVSRTGQRINQEKTIHANLPVYFFAVNGKVKMTPAGREKDIKFKFLTLPYKTIKTNDIFYAVAGIRGMTCGRVDFVDEIIDFVGLTHHIEADLLPL